MYEEHSGARKSQNVREIVGSFRRDVAIENDYLHFFSPGDEIFDCIIDNAMKSYRGTCTAFAFQADFEWMGLIFTWVLKPNEKLLLEKNIPLVAMRQYKNYISTEQISTAVPFPKFGDIDTEKVTKLVDRVTAMPISRIRDQIVHLGRRSIKSDFLHIKERFGCANVEWFKDKYPENIWSNFVNNAAIMGKEQAREKYKKGTNIKALKVFINRSLNAEIAQARFFGMDSGIIKKKREIYDIVIEALKTSTFEMESAAFVWVRKV